jgi:hypothetical protein
MKWRKEEFRDRAIKVDRSIGMGTAYFRMPPGGGNPLTVLLIQFGIEGIMVNQCANPKCCKPLHYLREGRIFVFDLPDPDVPIPAPGGRARRLQHFWLCGACSETMVMEQTANLEIRVALKQRKVETLITEVLPGLMAG